MWGFTRWGVTPDMVTLGKPMGNGHPIAAVITRSEIVDRFGAQTTFFSTFGGNPVACAAALAVLDVLEDEQLVVMRQRSASRCALPLGAGRAPRSDRRRTRPRPDDGRRLVHDRATREPAGELATRVKDEMAERGVLSARPAAMATSSRSVRRCASARDEARLIVTTLDDVLGG